MWPAGISATNVLGWGFLLTISHLPSKLRSFAKYSFFGEHISATDIPTAWRGLFISLNNLTQGNKVFNPSLEEEKLTIWVNAQFLGCKSGMYRLVGMQRLSQLIYAGIHVLHDIIHNLLCLQFLDDRNNGKNIRLYLKTEIVTLNCLPKITEYIV